MEFTNETWMWITTVGVAWVSLMALVLGLCVASGRSDRAAAKADDERRGPDDLVPFVRTHRFARRPARDRRLLRG
jgi:hypothetical protein